VEFSSVSPAGSGVLDSIVPPQIVPPGGTLSYTFRSYVGDPVFTGAIISTASCGLFLHVHPTTSGFEEPLTPWP
jgi:hypothetical protein